MKRNIILSAMVFALPCFAILAQNEPVGTPKGSFSVSPTGGAVYTIDIDVPQGYCGMQPQIGITYNSQSIEGIVGIGCNISGISCISHAPKDIYHDGAASGISYDANDALYLDGKRLLLTSGTAYTPGATYTVESDPFTVITVMSNGSGSGISFHVDTPDGMKYYYGSTSNSRIDINSTKTHSWYINRAEDARENYISYQYFQDNNCIYPDYIQYGMIDLDTGINNRVTFIYESRTTDVKHFYIENVSGSVTKRLKEIRTTTGTSVFRKYVLNYDDQTDGHSRLVSVTEKNGANESLRPITLSWDYLQRDSIIPVQPSIQLKESFVTLSFEERNFLAMDMNGDGIDDIIQISPSILAQNTPRTSAFIHLSQYGDSGICFDNPFCMNFDSDFKIDDWEFYNTSYSSTDFDGDGLSDLLIPNFQIVNHEGFDCIYFKIVLGKDVSNHISNPQLIAYILNNTNNPQWLTADFNGDGRTEVLIIEGGNHDGSYKSCYIHNLNSTGEMLLTPLMTSLSLDRDPESIQQGDFNGDGLTDLIVFFDNGYRVFFNNGNGTTSYPFSMSNSHYGTNLDYARRIYPGDFNGDGAVDFFINEKEAAECYFAFGHNDGTFTKNLACTLDGDLRDKNTGLDNDCFTILVTDFNNDGRSDIIIGKSDYEYHGLLHGYSYRHTTYCWKQSTGTLLTEVQRITFDDDRDGPMASHFLLGNFSGIGKEEILGYGRDITGADSSTDAKLRIYRCGYTPSDGKIVSITDGMGNYTNVNYATITDTLIYTKGTGSSYPMADCQVPFHVVSSTTASRGSLVDEQIRYKYGGLKLHQQGKGLLGFTTTIADNLTIGVKSTQTLDEWDADHILPLRATTVATQAGTTTRTIHKSSLVEYPGNNFKVYEDTVCQFDIFGNETLQTFERDTDHGYLLSQKTTDVPTGSYKLMSYSGYQYKGRTYLPTLVTQTQKHSDDQSTFVDKTRYTYTAEGLASSVTDHADTPKALTHTYTYDFIGNKLTETVGDNNSDFISQTTTYTYNTYRFVSRAQTLPASTDIRYTYDAFGNRLTMSDHTYGTILTTQYEYDNWGNLVNTISPEGVNTDITRGWSSGSGYYEQVESDGVPSVITHYDSYGRKIHEGSAGPDDISLNTAWSYNSNGLVTSEIKTTGNLQETHTYGYDDLGRMVGEVLPTGQTYTYSYGNRSKTSVTAGRTYTSTFDAWGNIKSSEDPVSSVTYEYYSNGQPKEIESDGETWHLEYDEAGNRTLLDDPDAGETEYLYDALGRLIEQEDARGYVTINTYDDKGHLASTETDGAVTTYTYGTIGNSKMRLIQVQDANGFISYTYDSVGRVKTKVRNLTGTGTYSSTLYAYNSLNQLVSRTCNGQIEQYYYDSNGYKCRSTINGQDVWQLVDYNGLQTTVQLGDSLSSITKRNLQGVTQLAVVLGNDTISNFRYEYSTATGNVTSRTGMLSSKESFGYDSVDRLTTVISPGNALLSMTYAANGNIMRKTGVGIYSYSGDQPHAVTNINKFPIGFGNATLSTSYNAFNKISDIRFGMMRNAFTYGPDQERWKSTYINGSKRRTTLYGDDYECITAGDTVRHFYYLDGGAIYVMESGKPDKLLFACTDNLGSIVKLVDDSGASVFNAKYDVWGYQTVTKNQIGFHRGFTGHEMLPDFCLINMNGRMYDPALGRFLSPDNYVQLGDFSQSYNRYSYCLNNPLKYNDPSGEIFWLIPAAIIVGSGVINAVMNSEKIHNFGQACSYFGVGCTSSVAAMYGGPVGIGLSGAILSGGNNFFAQRFAEGYQKMDWGSVAFSSINGFTISTLSLGVGNVVNNITNNFLNSIVNNYLRESLKGFIGGTITGGVMGAVTVSEGQDFWESVGLNAGIGAITGTAAGFFQARQMQAKVKQTETQYKKAQKPTVDISEKPMQMHHYLSDKNSEYTPLFKNIIEKYDLELKGSWNQELLPHLGRHPSEYHDWLLEELFMIDRIPGMNQQLFLQNFEIRIKQPIRNNPAMLYKKYWLTK